MTRHYILYSMKKALLMIQITPIQFQERYHISLSTQYRWRHERRIPFEKIGTHILYNQKEIDRLALQKELNSKAYLAIIDQKENT